ncbi:ribosomal eL8 family protein, partial [Fangia hongkongensis]|uniref:hypothetical protein n=2 Tax=Fangia hongkongensis TaxID=270495 RepID=UPI001905C72B
IESNGEETYKRQRETPPKYRLHLSDGTRAMYPTDPLKLTMSEIELYQQSANIKAQIKGGANITEEDLSKLISYRAKLDETLSTIENHFKKTNPQGILERFRRVFSYKA